MPRKGFENPKPEDQPGPPDKSLFEPLTPEEEGDNRHFQAAMQELARTNAEEDRKRIERERIFAEYALQLSSYVEKYREFKSFDKRHPIGMDDQLESEERLRLERERNELHIKLKEIGALLNKDANNVIVDILRFENSLEEYGLPEFSILKGSDLQYKRGDSDYYDFRTDALTADQASEDEESPFLEDDQILLVYAISDILAHGEGTEYPEDIDERSTRAALLAEAVGGEVVDVDDAGFHEGTVNIFGVALSKDKLTFACNLMRNEPFKFRIGEEFYEKKGRGSD